MVFSFFKKQPERKMGVRPPATPRTSEERGRVDDGPPEDRLRHAPTGPVGLSRAELPFATPVAKSDAPPLDLSEFVFSVMEPNFQPEVELDPVDAEAEEAAMLYANGQDAAVRSRLENATRQYRSGAGERLWLMLFDLFRVGGDKGPFEALGIEYAQVFEKSPPGWQETVRSAPVLIKAGTILFKGELTGDNEAGFAAVRQALATNQHLRLDLGKVRRLDEAGCERLLGLLQQAHKSRREVELLNRDRVAGLLDSRVVPGQQSDRACWLLKLEFCQLYDRIDVFEDLAIQYAVNFEISPPSWEPQRVAASGPGPLVLAATEDLMAEAYVIKGEVKSSRFGDLLAYSAANDPVLIDCSRVTRMDFLSAGALLNVLTTIKGSGRQIVFRHPNHLVAELFRVVGLRAVAEVVLARN
ncbi:MAG: anti-anti-sigma factor [Candidatus Accumulibacter adjunctus]|uniref:Anti-anti-sigma factor n=1 Tax=Candidatus Accumulibacter adjunctus TaxID=1454001 RepID=A0A011PSN3_9PROT|nr:MAG: anti-anti-sigma factor [Candidatus Accumulibacter adjunctus]